MGDLSPYAFANIIYWVLVTTSVIIVAYYLEKVFQYNREWFFWVIIFPLCIPFMVAKNWERYRAATFFFFLYLVMLIFGGILTNTTIGMDSVHLVLKIVFWPFFLGIWLAKTYILGK